MNPISTTTGRISSLGWFVFALSMFLGVRVYAQAPEEDFAVTGPVEVTGAIFDEAGEPLAGAQVFVESARPRQGSATNCPSCYPDCSKRARTDQKGEFTLPAMDSALLFRLVLVAKGYESSVMDKVDPLLSPLSFSLGKREPLNEEQRLINARVYDSTGKPAAGAIVEVEGAETGNMTTWGGHKKYIQETGVSDENGVMSLVAAAELNAGLAVLRGRGAAQQWVRLLPGKDHLFVLREGVAVTGRLLKQGQPVPGVPVAFSGADRSAGEFLHGWTVVTDDKGHFRFEHVTAEKGFVVYTLAKSSVKTGVVAPRAITTGADGTTTDLGTLELQPPVHIRGRVLLEDGEPAPPGSQIGLSREQAWDYQDTRLSDEGEFEFNGLGQELVEISARISGYKFSKKNPSRLSSRSLAGRLTGHLEGFLIVLEPSDDGDDHNPEDYNWNVRETPLRSAKP